MIIMDSINVRNTNIGYWNWNIHRARSIKEVINRKLKLEGLKLKNFLSSPSTPGMQAKNLHNPEIQ